MKDDIYLIGERVTRLLHRIKKWKRLASTPAAQRKLAILLYGFPPGVGAAGTAALLNVPESLEQCLQALRDEVRLRCMLLHSISSSGVLLPSAGISVCKRFLCCPCLSLIHI